MRHWLAGVLAKERPALFRDLPESFKVGHPLPRKTESRSQNSESRNVEVILSSNKITGGAARHVLTT
jgi:hypothetical protein